MSALYTNGPAKRLLYSACRKTRVSRMVTSTERAAHSLMGWEARGGRRQYATKRLKPNARPVNPPSPRPSAPPSSPPPARAPRTSSGKHVPPSNRDPARLLFSTQDIPPLQEWMTSLEGLGNKHLTPLQCVDGARRYVSVATQHESEWRPKLEKEYNLSPFMLHWIGILLVSGNSAARWRLGTHMLRSASELGYMPSTLTLVRIFRSVPPHMFARAANTVMYREANARFQEAVKAGTDPDALTLQGIIHAKAVDKGSQLKALVAFDSATKAWQRMQRENGTLGEETEADVPGKGTQALATTSECATSSDAAGDTAPASRHFTLPPPREPRWDWEVSCILGQANILVKDRDTAEEALKLFRVAALELDNPLGFLMLAKLMGGPRNSPERRVYLLKAAISGETDACREIGELEALAAANQDISQKERAEHDMLSKEWFRLADGEDLSAFIKDNVGNRDVDD